MTKQRAHKKKLKKKQTSNKQKKGIEVDIPDTKILDSNKKKTNKTLPILLVPILVILLFFVYKIFFINTIDQKLINKNIFLITLDTFRADYLSAYKEGNAETPNLDKIAEEGVLFEKCIAQSPLTLPSHTTILSGTYPQYNNVRDNGGFKVSEKLEFISEKLKQNGYKTSAFISSFVLHSKWGMNQGFNLYQDDFDISNLNKSGMLKIQLRADEVIKRAKKWIKKNKHNRIFSWLHFYDPHTPYNPPPEYKKKHPDNLYRGEIEYLDSQIGQFIEFLKEESLYKDSIFIIVGDHGEGLNQHQEKTHGIFIYDEISRVPLIIKTPYAFPQKKVNIFVELVDLAPTILETQKIEIPKSYQGESLINLMLGNKKRKKKFAYTESYYPRFHYGWSELKGFYLKNNFKYIIAPKIELYDLNTDPKETKNIAATHSRIINKNKNKISKFLKRSSKNALKLEKTNNFNAADIKKLKSLGYLSGVSDVTKKKDLPNPKDKIYLLDHINKANTILENKKRDPIEAIEILKKIVKENPYWLDAQIQLGKAYKIKRMPKQALKVYYDILSKKPDYNIIMTNILNTLKWLKAFDKGIEEAKRFLKIFPDDFIILNSLGEIYFETKDFDKAIETFKKSVKIEKSNINAYSLLGRLFIEKKKYREAEKYLLLSIKLNPKFKETYFYLGVLEKKRKNLDKEIAYYRKELINYPDSDKTMFNLAIALRKKNKTSEAIKLFKHIIKIKPQFKIPYLMAAMDISKMKGDLKEAVSLCKRGVALKPLDQYTVMGYYLLADLYIKLKKPNLSKQSFNTGNMLKKKMENN